METKFRMWLGPEDEQTAYDGVWRDLRVLEGEWKRKLDFLAGDDIPGMVRYFERRVHEEPKDLDLLRDLGEAYMLAGKYQQVVDLLLEPQASHPDYLEFQYLILDALFAQELDENAMEWPRSVPVVRLDERVLAVCREYLGRDGGPRPIDQLYAEVMLQGYCAFAMDDLLVVIERDPRFRVSRRCVGDPWPEVELCVERRQEPM